MKRRNPIARVIKTIKHKVVPDTKKQKKEALEIKEAKELLQKGLGEKVV